MITVFWVTVIISKPGRSFPHWLASKIQNTMKIEQGMGQL